MKNLSLLFLIFIFYSITIQPQVTIHIPGDYPTIQQGINAASNGDLVLVADGTYIENINFKGKAITVASHFIQDGNKSHIENTIIDGSQPSNPDSGSVVLFKSGEDTSSVLKGFTIRNGTGTVGPLGGGGGGILIFDNSGALISNNIIENNSINFSNAYGGGIDIGLTSSYTTILKFNIIRNNSAIGSNEAWGGGICANQCGPISIQNNIVENNSVEGSHALGGGISLFMYEVTHINSNKVTNNQALGPSSEGGGMSIRYSTSPIFLSNNLIAENVSVQGGGILVENQSEGDSHRMRNFNYKDQTFGENAKVGQYTFLSNKILDEAVIENNTVVNNEATSYCGGILCFNTLPEIRNSIIWGNEGSGNQIHSTGIVEYSDVEGGYTGIGNIDSLPLFTNLEYYLLDPNSPCVDAGDPDPIYNDVEDPNNPGYALFPALGSLTNDMGTFGGPSSTWSSIILDTLRVPTDYATIQEAIDVAVDGNVVLVAEGTYYENINYKGKAITVASHFLVDEDTSHISNTIINGSQPSHPDSGSVVSFVSGEDTTSILCGFTITGGTGTYNPVWTEFEGGGVFCSHSGAKIIYNKVMYNEVIYSIWAAGGGIFMDFEEEQYWTVIENNIISNNYAEAGSPAGGGIFIGNNSIIKNNIIENNTCFGINNQNYLYGGGIGVDGSINWTHTIYCYNNVIKNNTISGGLQGAGAGIWMDDGDFYIKGNNVSDNNVEQAAQIELGVGIHITNPDTTCQIIGNTISSNTGDFNINGGAICITNDGGTSITIDGNLIEANEATYGGGLVIANPVDANIINNLFVGNNAALLGGAIYFTSQIEESHLYNGVSKRGVSKNLKTSSQKLLFDQPVVINNTFTLNTALHGGAFYNRHNTELVILNSIFWENEASVGMDLYQYSNPDVYVFYSDIKIDSIYGNWIGDENIYADPLFVNTIIGDFSLQDASLCIGAGINSLDINGTMYYCPPFCYYGSQRPNPDTSFADIGACESQLANPVSVGDNLLSIPIEYSLAQNYPNPFNPVTTIKYGIPERTFVQLKVYDILGREVLTLVNEEQDGGYYEFNFNASQLASGIYLYQLRAGSFVETKKMILLK